MTKIGSGNVPAEEPSLDTYKRQLDASSTKFIKALEEYHNQGNSDKKTHLKSVMDQQMAIIRSSIGELNKRGLHKDAMKVSKDYMDFLDEQSSSNYTCLRNDMETLRELNKSS